MLSVGKDERSLSVLCADVTGGPRLSRYLDRPDALYALGRCERRVRRSVERHGGSLVNRVNGKLLAFFSDGVGALESAIEMQHRVSDLPPYAGSPLAVRVAICSGHQSKEARYFPSEGANPAVSLSEAADPAHILLSVPKRTKFFPWSQLASDAVPGLTLSCGKRQLGVFQVAWQERPPAALQMALAQLGSGIDRLSLRHNGVEIVLDGNRPVLTIGRQAGCDVLLRDTRSSRVHGTIERRLERFVFIDRSTNGTFVTLEDQIEFFVHRKELVLFGHGQLSLGAPSSAKGAELLHFQTSSFP